MGEEAEEGAEESEGESENNEKEKDSKTKSKMAKLASGSTQTHRIHTFLLGPKTLGPDWH